MEPAPTPWRRLDQSVDDRVGNCLLLLSYVRCVFDQQRVLGGHLDSSNISDQEDLSRALAALDVIHLGYFKMHDALFPGWLGTIARQLRLRPQPNFVQLQPEVRLLDEAARAAIATLEAILKRWERRDGSVPSALKARYLHGVNEANVVILLRAIVDGMASDDYTPQLAASHFVQYQASRRQAFESARTLHVHAQQTMNRRGAHATKF